MWPEIFVHLPNQLGVSSAQAMLDSAIRAQGVLLISTAFFRASDLPPRFLRETSAMVLSYGDPAVGDREQDSNKSVSPCAPRSGVSGGSPEAYPGVPPTNRDVTGRRDGRPDGRQHCPRGHTLCTRSTPELYANYTLTIR